MFHTYWNNWNFGWGWVIWFVFLFVLFSNIGNWSYTYRAHRKFDTQSGKDAFDILSERYARGEINENEYFKMKADIAKGN
jgi:putative membrane protein